VNFLADLDQLVIKQPVRGKELFFEQCLGCEMSNYYEAQSITESADGQRTTGRQLFKLHEESNCCMRQLCGPRRPLALNAVFPDQEEDAQPLFQILQPYRCGCCCIPSTECMGRSYMEVVVGGVEIGSIRQDCVCDCNVNYSIYDCNEQLLCKIRRFFCHCECSKNVFFHIFDANDEETGKSISKEFGGWLTELFTDSDTFLVQFPECMMTIERKLLLIGAAMMIEFRHFEQPPNEGADGM